MELEAARSPFDRLDATPDGVLTAGRVAGIG